jgi:aryl-alcohol dehydrogenase-like predicted oxidoreductase
MRYIDAGGLRTSLIGLGTWQFGSREWGYGEDYATEVAPALLRRAVELGITLIDTAEGYGPGRSERIIGATLAGMPESDRASLTIATKFLPIAPAEPILAWQAAGSRRRLGVDVLDLYYAHWPNPFVSPRRVIQSLRPLLEDGLVRRVAVSNYSLDQWRAAERALGGAVVANQVRFSLVSPGPARDLVPYAADHRRLVVAYSPLGQGLLAGARGSGSIGGIRAMNPAFREAGRRRAGPLVLAVHEIADARGATPAQVALAWVIRHPNTVAIPGARTIAQLEENVAAVDLELSDEDFARLSAEAEAFAAGQEGAPGAGS